MRYRGRFLALFAVVLAVILVSSWLYMLGMAHLEGKPRDFWTSFGFAAETITTTGYGGDSHWNSPVMVIFIVILQLFGVMLIYMVVPLFLIPALEERFESRLPRRARQLDGQVLIYRYGPAVESALAELDRAGVPVLVLETDADVARSLRAERRRVVYGKSAIEILENIELAGARALIANGSDEENAGLVLSARQAGFDGEILALVEEPFHRTPLQLAGASAVFNPRVMLAALLAARASHRLEPRVRGLQHIGDRVLVAELRLDAKSPLAGRTLVESRIGERTGTTVIGQWRGGTLIRLPPPDSRLQPHDILIAVGGAEGIQQLAELTGDRAALDRRRGPFIVAGYGEVGRRVVNLLQEVSEEVVVIDRRPADDRRVDHVGDVRDHALLDAIGLERVRAAVLALDSDSATLFATVIIRDRAPELPIIARVNEVENVERIHRAGADFALSISQVAGQMLAKRLLGRQEVVIEPELTLTRIPAGGLAGRHPAELRLRQRTGCSVVAVERGDDVLVRFGPDFRFQPDDAVFVCGSGEARERFIALADAAAAG
ncbi:MAG: hypothetical protein D6696_13000 [Acidobacteria bacterium]|nr:MAG: hypothetical protein D6696_13000 [Acidobacteriota bacterium]